MKSSKAPVITPTTLSLLQDGESVLTSAKVSSYTLRGPDLPSPLLTIKVSTFQLTLPASKSIRSMSLKAPASNHYPEIEIGSSF